LYSIGAAYQGVITSHINLFIYKDFWIQVIFWKRDELLRISGKILIIQMAMSEKGNLDGCC